MNLSFHEKSLWLMLLSLILAFGVYFATVLPTASPEIQPQQIALFTVLVALLVVVQIVGHIVIAIADRRPGTDERGRLIELRGVRNGAYVLGAGVFASLCLALFTEGNFLFTHVLLGFWVLAHVVEIASQLVLYRRGA